MSYNGTEIGLVFFDDINKQARYKPYFNTYEGGYIYPINLLPQFQFYGYEAATGLTNLDIINIDTGASTSFLSHFNTYGSITPVGDIDQYYLYDSTQSVTLAEGRYYIYAKDDLDQEWWSEVFCVKDIAMTAEDGFNAVEAGLPFFDNINKQVRNKPYYSASLRNWLAPSNRFPSFQFRLTNLDIATLVTFDLINVDTGVSTSYLTHFNTYLDVTDTGDYTYFTYMGLEDVTVSEGKYYFYVEAVDGEEWWSEVFTICGDISVETDYLLLGSGDYLLLDGSDKLKIG